uniref:Uncharacterized protein n=1 Tax=Arundo donax TaxID=35708 RepID=A0A0A8Z485_ARUDO
MTTTVFFWKVYQKPRT